MISLLLSLAVLVIGGMAGIKYREYETQLNPEDKLFLYTDGVPEATDAEKELFGTERMLAALNEGKDGSPEQVLESVRRAVDDFVKNEEQFDDMTIGIHGHRIRLAISKDIR